jgi:hypothetical protein
MSMFVEALFGSLVGKGVNAVLEAMRGFFMDSPQERVLSNIVKSSIGSAVQQVVTPADQASIEKDLREHLTARLDLSVDDVLDPLDVVCRWLGPLTQPSVNGQGYLQWRSVDSDLLAEVLAAEIMRGVEANARMGGRLRDVLGEVRYKQVLTQLDRIESLVKQHTALSGRGGAKRPFMVPARLRRVVDRRGLSSTVLELLCREQASTVALSTALRGAGGFGKTTLAEEICRDTRVRERFPGGVLWAILGEQKADSRIAAEINSLSEELSGDRPPLIDPERAGRRLGELLGDQPTLLVVDDVWTRTQMRSFLYGPPSCARLFTTRNASSLPDDASTVIVDAMDTDEARDVLRAGLQDVADEQLDPLLSRTGRWPVLLALINGQLNRLVEHGNSPVAALMTRQLRTAGPAALDLRQVEQRRDAVTATMEASLQFLASERAADLERYLQLAAFRADWDIPLSMLELAWGLPPAETHQLCMHLADLSLVQRYQLEPPRIRLHDVIRSYLRYRVGKERLQEMNAALLDLFGDPEVAELNYE